MTPHSNQTWHDFIPLARFKVAAVAVVLLTSLLVPPPVAAVTPCGVWYPATWTDGVLVGGSGWIDCPLNPQSKSLEAKLYENYGPFTWQRDHDAALHTSSAAWSVSNVYNCNGHGTDDWWGQAYGRDQNNGTSGWIAGVITSHTC